MSTEYRPQSNDRDKIAFLEELRMVRQSCPGMLMICGDLNLIYRTADKSNVRLNLCMMGRFCRFIDDMHLQELHLKGRRYTWSSQRDSPTLEKLDRFLVSDDWLAAILNHDLSRSPPNALTMSPCCHAPTVPSHISKVSGLRTSG